MNKQQITEAKAEYNARISLLKGWLWRKRAKALSKQSVYTHAAAAKHWGVSVHGFSKWLRGERRVPDVVVKSLKRMKMV